jgi:hypothetical protein
MAADLTECPGNSCHAIAGQAAIVARWPGDNDDSRTARPLVAYAHDSPTRNFPYWTVPTRFDVGHLNRHAAALFDIRERSQDYS